MSRLSFKIEQKCPLSHARAARFQTLHGPVQTPIFMPVGTQATVKSQTVESLKAVGSNILLANTYHLMLRPGIQVFEKFGGIHRFMNWDQPVLTDSGGFQIFSLPHSRDINENGAHFKSYVDGKMHLLSPEESIRMQRAIGSDIMMVLDQCIPSTASHEQARAAMTLTHRWAKRSLDARQDSPQSLFGIVQGACFQDLRKESSDFLTQLPFDGFAIGGLAVGESKEQRDDFTEWTAQLLPQDLPRYLMGVGTPLDILEAVHRGVDMFDCIMPSAFAQRGTAFSSQGKIQLRRSVYKFSESKLDPACSCNTCENYSRAYLHHLHKSDEPLGWTLIAQHNLFFYHQMMREIRNSILAGNFPDYYQSRRSVLGVEDLENPPQVARHRSKQKPDLTSLGDFELHTTSADHWTIRHKSSGEVMHPVLNPMLEAKNLYVDQSNIFKTEFPENTEIVVWDVGLGSAMNAMAMIHEYEAVKNRSWTLKLISFECCLDPLRLSLQNCSRFPHLQHPAPHHLLKDKTWKSSSVTWELLEGDFQEGMFSAPSPDFIFYDPFSTHTDKALWEPEHFFRLMKVLTQKPCSLYTYTSSTAVRSALLAAGFFVSSGIPTGSRTETTVAFTQLPQGFYANRLLDSNWIKRWNRSEKKYPTSVLSSDFPSFEKKILNHPQFHNT